MVAVGLYLQGLGLHRMLRNITITALDGSRLVPEIWAGSWCVTMYEHQSQIHWLTGSHATDIRSQVVRRLQGTRLNQPVVNSLLIVT